MNKLMDFGDRLQLAMTAANVSRKDLAAKLGISVQAIGMVISGQSKAFTAENNAMAADYLGCKSLWLATGKGEMTGPKGQEIDLENNPDFPAIKKVRLRVSAGVTGFGVEPCAGDDSLIVFRADWYQSRRLKPENLLALKVSGTSMEPNLYDGDVVVMNKADTELIDGEVFVFNLDGEVVIKRAVRDGGQWWLDSDNQDKTRFTRKACPDGICIPLGKVIHRQTERI